MADKFQDLIDELSYKFIPAAMEIIGFDKHFEICYEWQTYDELEGNFGNYHRISNLHIPTINLNAEMYDNLDKENLYQTVAHELTHAHQDLVQGILYDHNPYRHTFKTMEEYCNLAIEKEAFKMEELVWRKYCYGNK